ncbi:non-hydrolyzing UDP-N-acetylglucosamine 2-epimerase [Arhodomonas sp. SL1]|uniref:non-hydrolyzing UDP-N-acetylglucosamine 2-epimerase n=1 Tax=Arhodomonas sp. SL1 TaxID=3425691 RepID=UPI003F884965
MSMTVSCESSRAPVLCVVGARPNFIKMAPLLDAFASARSPIPFRLVHTGQHYDVAMNEQHFRALELPRPDVSLEVGSASHAVQTAEIMRRFEPVVEVEAAAAVLVVGDVNSTLACALVAAKLGVPVIHVEAGLRSFDRAMPEEINRVLTDQLADLLFTTEEGASANLRREGIDPGRIHFAGNVMIDSVHRCLPRAISAADTLKEVGRSTPRCYGLITLHRPVNVDDRVVLSRLLETLAACAADLPMIWPLHPRTRARIEAAGLMPRLSVSGLHVLPPVDYRRMLGLLAGACVVLTDSGGLQEESTALGVPCLTLREGTERPVTVIEGTNTLVGTDPGAIYRGVAEVRAGRGKRGRLPAGWDGRAAERIAAVLGPWLARQRHREVA